MTRPGWGIRADRKKMAGAHIEVCWDAGGRNCCNVQRKSASGSHVEVT